MMPSLTVGIALVDMVAIVGQPPFWMGIMLLLFVSALLFQRFVPAT